MGDLADEGVQIARKRHPASPGAGDGEVLQLREEFKRMSTVGLDAIPVGRFGGVQLSVATDDDLAIARTQKTVAAYNTTVSSSFLIVCPGAFPGLKMLESGGNMFPRMGEWKVAEWRYETTSEERYALQALLFSFHRQ